MKKTVRCTRIGVDCVANDPTDIRCGGPEYLGFDFNIRKEQTEEMKKFIVEALNNFGIPLIAIYSRGEMDLSEEKVWPKERIVGVISKDANYLKSEASRDNVKTR